MTCEDWYKSQPFYGLGYIYTSSDNANGGHKDCSFHSVYLRVCLNVLLLLFFFFRQMGVTSREVRDIRSFRQKVLSTFKLWTCNPGQVCLLSALFDHNFYFTVVIHLFLPRLLNDLCFTESSRLLYSYYSRYPLRTLLNNDRENSYTAKTFVRGVLLLFSIFGRPCVIRTGVPGGRCL